jgi:hypothetical protein
MQSDTHSLTSQFACPAQIPCKRDRLLKLLEYAFLPQNGISGNFVCLPDDHFGNLPIMRLSGNVTTHSGSRQIQTTHTIRIHLGKTRC